MCRNKLTSIKDYYMKEELKMGVDNESITILDFINIPDILSTKAFDVKMRICSFYSAKWINTLCSGRDGSEVRDPLPWELEVFLLFAIKSHEQGNDELNKTEFINIINSIRDYIIPGINIENLDGKNLGKIIIGYGMTQFKNQYDTNIELYRHNFYFGFKNEIVDVKQEFKKNLGVNIKSLLCLLL